MKAELKREWVFTPGAEWIVWSDETGKIKAFRVILGDERRFLEWSFEDGFRAGSSDDGEKPGRAKMAPVLVPHSGLVGEVARTVAAKVAALKQDPPRMGGRKIELPEGMLEFIGDVVGSR